jgi:hypothetical protein
MSGGNWATGYAGHGDEVFVFCNIGVAGRTGHDYPNRWIDDALDWFGKTGSTPDQPMISAMVTGAVVTHVFWRGRDRAPFTYAGVGVAEGVWGERPAEVLWRFDETAQLASVATGGSLPLAPNTAAAAAFRHGPPPSFGFKQMLAEDGECRVYLMVLEGAVDALFPALAPTTTNRSIVKVGISRDPQRRQRELNASFPKGAAARWALRKTRTFATVGTAYNAEGVLLERLSDSHRWISGEFAIVANDDLEILLG